MNEWVDTATFDGPVALVSTAADKIRARIEIVEGMVERRKAYRQDCINDEDEHGCWDAAVNIAEFKSELAGLRFALEAIEGS